MILLILIIEMSEMLDSDNFEIALYLASSCKKHHGYYEDGSETLEIDFIEL